MEISIALCERDYDSVVFLNIRKPRHRNTRGLCQGPSALCSVAALCAGGRAPGNTSFLPHAKPSGDCGLTQAQASWLAIVAPFPLKPVPFLERGCPKGQRSATQHCPMPRPPPVPFTSGREPAQRDTLPHLRLKSCSRPLSGSQPHPQTCQA